MKGPQFAITGGIACGKSEVGNLLTRLGVRVLDTDIVGHDVIRTGQPAHSALIEAFGEEICDSLGEIDRSILGRLVFSDPDKRQQLNTLVHPRIRDVWQGWITERRRRNEAAAVLIPLLFESGADDWPWDAIVCVSTPEAIVIERLQRRGLDAEAARRRIAAQLPLAEKERTSDIVIRNEGTLEELEARTRAVLETLIENAS